MIKSAEVCRYRANLQRLAEGLHRPRDPIDPRSVTNVRQPVHLLRCRLHPARQLCRTNPLPDHFIQQKHLRRNAGGEFNEILTAFHARWLWDNPGVLEIEIECGFNGAGCHLL
jgi:hypothetical protein